MTPIYKLSASSVTGRTNYGSMLAGNPTYELPGDYQSIATVTVGSGGSATVSFTSIPSNYVHLQIRGLVKYTPTGNDRSPVWFRFNSDSGNNYSNHNLYATGSSALTDASTSQNKGRFVSVTAPSSYSSYANIFGVFVADILDYKDTNKYKTTRGLGGYEANTSTYSNVSFTSSLWQSTNAITSIEMTPDSGNWAQYSHFALYGIKGVA